MATERTLTTVQKIQSLRDQIKKLSGDLRIELAKQLETARQTYQELLETGDNHRSVFTDPQFSEVVSAFKIQTRDDVQPSRAPNKKERRENPDGRTFLHILKEGPMTSEEIARRLVERGYTKADANMVEDWLKSEKMSKKFPLDSRSSKYGLAK